jgi:prepilin-type N-terminal cleavage/methylation domain-containing protein
MICRLQKASSTSDGRNRAFTLLELLVVMAVIGVLTATIVPALSKAKQRSIQTGCLSNLKQVGIALQLYVSDNEDSLPGPVFSGARASYDKNSSTELIWYIADYLDAPSPSTVSPNKPVVAEVFVCPGYLRYAPGLTSMQGRKCYLLNDNVGERGPVARVPPFGYPSFGEPASEPIATLKLSELEAYVSPALAYAITDVDWLNINPSNTGWWQDVPSKPVHGNVRTELYFDWHVASKQISW